MPHHPIEIGDHPGQSYRFYGAISPTEHQRTPIKAELTPTTDGKQAVIRLYDPIDSWGDNWGVSAKEFVAALDEIGEVDNITLRINSPGGDAFEGIAIYNALVNHPATVNVIVDALAASAASVVAMAGDTITMSTASQLMIHEAWGVCMGDTNDMTSTAEMLNRMSDNIASDYTERAGGDLATWRGAMIAETWYSGAEAVKAGLATSVAKKSADTKDAKASFDLTVFNYAGRAKAPAPALDTKTSKVRASVPDSSNQQENNRMTAEQLQAMGLPQDATDEQISARIDELTKDETPAPEKPAAEPEAPEVVEAPVVEEPLKETELADAKLSLPDNVVVVDKAQWSDIQARIERTESDLEKRKTAEASAERDSILNSAIKDGKIAPAQRKDYEALLLEAPAQAKALINSMARNSIPVDEIGRADDVEGAPAELPYSPQFLTRSEKERITNFYQGVL